MQNSSVPEALSWKNKFQFNNSEFIRRDLFTVPHALEHHKLKEWDLGRVPGEGYS